MEQEIDRRICAVDRCGISSDAGSASACRGEEGAEPEREALDLPVNLHSYPHQ